MMYNPELFCSRNLSWDRLCETKRHQRLLSLLLLGVDILVIGYWGYTPLILHVVKGMEHEVVGPCVVVEFSLEEQQEGGHHVHILGYILCRGLTLAANQLSGDPSDRPHRGAGQQQPS